MDLISLTYDRSAKAWEVFRIADRGGRWTERFFHAKADAVAHATALRDREATRAQAEPIPAGPFVRAVRANIAAMTEATGLDALAVGSGVAALATIAGVGQGRALGLVLRAQGSANL